MGIVQFERRGTMQNSHIMILYDTLRRYEGLRGAKMSEVKVDKGEQPEERIDQGRREALTRLAMYTAPAMLAVLMSVEQGRAAVCVSAACISPPK
jgi:hypothetical protein